MSWRVQTLLMNSEIIRAEENIESDDFNDLLVLESKIKELFLSGLLTNDELNIINLIQTSHKISDISERLNRSRFALAKDFVTLCDRIAFTLGNGFTDDGYIEELSHKNNFDEEDIILLKTFMKSKYT